MTDTGARRVRGALGLAFAALVIACGRPPDVVLVSFDTLRRDHVGAYGAPAPSPTPHLDALAARGRTFTGALTTMPTTSPAHASIFTGLHPRDHGVLRNGDRVTEAVAAERSLPQQLVRAGYRVGAFVTTNVFGGAIGLGGFAPFDDEGTPLRPGPDAVAAALRWLDGAGPREPVFLWVHFYDPHSPYGPAAQKPAHYPVDLGRYGWVEPGYYADPAARAAMAALYAEGAREADAALGALVAGVAARGRDPFWLVTSDHGEFLDEHLDALGFAYGHGSLLGREVLDVPLVLAGPGIEPARVAGAVSLVDLYATILELAGLGDPRAAAEGRVDLRGAPPEGRVVTAARRFFTPEDRQKKMIGDAAAREIRARAVAASDGRTLVVVGEDGAPAQGDLAGAPLARAAADALAAQRAGEDGRGPSQLEPDVRERLEALGYVEGDD